MRRRREFLSAFLGLGMALVQPLAGRSQQLVLRKIGFLSARSSGDSVGNVKAFLEGLREVGYLEGRNVAIQYRWAEGHFDRLPAFAADLVAQSPDLIVTAGAEASALAAKAATVTIPIVFLINADPVKLGLVAQFSRPAGNVTGFTMGSTALIPKRLELLRELVPHAIGFGLLVNPQGPTAKADTEAAQEAARSLGIRLQTVTAPVGINFDDLFESFVNQGGQAISVLPDASWNFRADRLIAAISRHRLPTVFPWRSFTEIDGLMSYGTDQLARYREAGQYAGRILSGAKPSDLPVQEPTRFELVINLKTAKALGLTIPQALFARADEVIE